MGLDNSGKTSIILNILGVKNLQAFANLSPTKGHDIKNLELLDSNYSLWDLGGQDALRKDNLEYFERLGKDLDKLIYVIDIQDDNRYELTLDYLEKIILVLQKYELRPHISVFLHKYDPDLKNYRRDFDEQKANELIEKLKKILPKSFNYTILKTSIHTTFSQQNVFSNPL